MGTQGKLLPRLELQTGNYRECWLTGADVQEQKPQQESAEEAERGNRAENVNCYLWISGASVWTTGGVKISYDTKMYTWHHTFAQTQNRQHQEWTLRETIDFDMSMWAHQYTPLVGMSVRKEAKHERGQKYMGYLYLSLNFAMNPKLFLKN